VNEINNRQSNRIVKNSFALTPLQHGWRANAGLDGGDKVSVSAPSSPWFGRLLCVLLDVYR
jgi:hypothetical protein